MRTFIETVNAILLLLGVRFQCISRDICLIRTIDYVYCRLQLDRQHKVLHV